MVYRNKNRLLSVKNMTTHEHAKIECQECGEKYCGGCGREEDFAEKYIGDFGLSWLFGTFVVYPLWVLGTALFLMARDLWKIIKFCWNVISFPVYFYIVYKRHKREAQKSKAEKVEENVEFLEASTEERVNDWKKREWTEIELE